MALIFRPLVFIEKAFVQDVLASGFMKSFKKYYDKLRVADVYFDFGVSDALIPQEKGETSWADLDSYLGNMEIHENYNYDDFINLKARPSIFFTSNEELVKASRKAGVFIVSSKHFHEKWERNISNPILNFNTLEFLHNNQFDKVDFKQRVSSQLKNPYERQLIMIDKLLMEKPWLGLKAIKYWFDCIYKKPGDTSVLIFTQKINDEYLYANKNLASEYKTKISEFLNVPLEKVCLCYFPSTTSVSNVDLKAYIGSRFQMHDRLLYGINFFLNATGGLRIYNQANNSMFFAFNLVGSANLYKYTIELNVLIDLLIQQNQISKEQMKSFFHLE